MSLSMLAAAGGQDDILRLLIKKGVKVNGRQKNGTTALMHAADKVIIALLLKLFCSCSAALHSPQKTFAHVSHCVLQSYWGKKVYNNFSLPPEFPHHCGRSSRGRILLKCSDTGWGNGSYEGKNGKEQGRLHSLICKVRPRDKQLFFPF